MTEEKNAVDSMLEALRVRSLETAPDLYVDEPVILDRSELARLRDLIADVMVDRLDEHQGEGKPEAHLNETERDVRLASGSLKDVVEELDQIVQCPNERLAQSTLLVDAEWLRARLEERAHYFAALAAVSALIGSVEAPVDGDEIKLIADERFTAKGKQWFSELSDLTDEVPIV